jgi:hypothetical protein
MWNWLLDNIAGEIVAMIIGALVTWIVSNHKQIKTAIYALIYRKTDFRVSISYLFRIKIDNKYLLVKGNRIEQFQPVGGVYKYYASFKNVFDSLELRSENESTFYEENDLRIYVKGQFLNQFIKWFESSKNRECTVGREFIEELIDTNFIDDSIMQKVHFEFLRRINEGVHYSKHFRCKEVLIFDIYDVILNKEAERKLKQSVENTSNLILVPYNDIEKECTDIEGKSTKIGAHAKHIK